MKKSRFSESQIVSILKESEGGITIADILRTHGISQGTFYKWRSKYSGLEVSELKRMKDLGSSYLNIKRWLLSFLEITEHSRISLKKSSNANG
jgi:putative transposase